MNVSFKIDVGIISKSYVLNTFIFVMTGTTTYLESKELDQKGTFNQSGSEYTLDNIVFRKSKTWNGGEIEQAKDACNKYHKFDLNTLIVKEENKITIWIEKKSSITATKKNTEPQETIQTQEERQPISTKTITKKYRGKEYEQVVVDSAAIQQTDLQNKPRRKYRGRYID